ncbi:MAG: hypothetical protein HY552_03970 [Elusimicrobia bacterium]|nr:hypothetical protein [Elusimicrobiota bacterium]
MSRWHDVFNAQQPIERVKEALRLLESAKTDKLTGDDLPNYARLLKAVKAVLACLQNLDPELYHPNAWANIGTWSNNLQNYATAFSQNPNAGAINNANSMADELLAFLRPSERQDAGTVVATVTEAAKAFQSKISEELLQIRKGVTDEKAAVAAITKSIDAEKARLDGLAALIEQQKGRLDQSIAAYQQQFTSAETTRTNTYAADAAKRAAEFQQLLKAREEDAKKFQEAQKTRGDEFFKDLQKKSDQHLQNLKTREAEVDKIFGAIGSASFAGHFKTTADTERSTADWLRTAALWLMGAMIVVAGIAFFFSIFHDVSWHTFAFRLGTAVVIAIPAIYAAQESSKHRDRENALRKTHLELASIDAYLVLLPEAQRNEIKARLTEKFFGREEPKEKEEAVSKHALFELMSSVLKNLTKAK